MSDTLRPLDIDTKSRVADRDFDVWLERNLDIIRHWLAAEVWHTVGVSGEPAFENSWANYGGTNEVAAYMHRGDTYLSIIGAVKNGPTGDSTVFTLAAEHAPDKVIELPAIVHKTSGVELAALVVNPNGTVQLHGISAAAVYVSMHVTINLENVGVA